MLCIDIMENFAYKLCAYEYLKAYSHERKSYIFSMVIIQCIWYICIVLLKYMIIHL